MHDIHCHCTAYIHAWKLFFQLILKLLRRYACILQILTSLFISWHASQTPIVDNWLCINVYLEQCLACMNVKVICRPPSATAYKCTAIQSFSPLLSAILDTIKKKDSMTSGGVIWDFKCHILEWIWLVLKYSELEKKWQYYIHSGDQQHCSNIPVMLTAFLNTTHCMTLSHHVDCFLPEIQINAAWGWKENSKHVIVLTLRQQCVMRQKLVMGMQWQLGIVIQRSW